jgi:putative transposase
VVSEAVEQF